MKADFPRLFRFAVTGALVALVYVVGYTLMYHAGITPLIANTVAFLVAVLIQYVMQTVWTFRRPLWDGQQSLRFFAIIGLGLVYSSVFASLVGPAFEWRPWVAAGFVAVTLPVINYISFRLWVFGPDQAQKDT